GRTATDGMDPPTLTRLCPTRAGYQRRMSRASALLAVLTDQPASTSELFDRVGYATLVCVGLVRYEAFRADLMRLSAAGPAARDATGGVRSPRGSVRRARRRGWDTALRARPRPLADRA